MGVGLVGRLLTGTCLVFASSGYLFPTHKSPIGKRKKKQNIRNSMLLMIYPIRLRKDAYLELVKLNYVYYFKFQKH